MKVPFRVANVPGAGSVAVPPGTQHAVGEDGQPTGEQPALASSPPSPADRRLPWWFHVLALFPITLLVVYVARGMWGWTYDDVYIIFRYARNFAAGLGMVYNPGEHYLGTSSVGYTLLLAALHLIIPGVDIPVLGSAVYAAGVWASGALLWAIGVQTGARLAGFLAALITVVNPMIVEMWGGEMGLLVPLVLATVLVYSRGAGTATGVLLALAVLTRQDSLVLVGLLGAHFVWTRRRLPLGGGAVFLLVLAPWLLYSWVFYGSPLPGTLEAKVAQGQAGWPLFFSGSLSWLSDTLGPGFSRPLTLVLMPVGALILVGAYIQQLRGRRAAAVDPWLLIIGWAVLFSLGYVALRVAFYGWYDVPIAVTCGILVAWALAGLVTGVQALSRRLLNHGGPGDNSPPEPATNNSIARYPVLAAGVIILLLLGWPLADRLRYFTVHFINTHRESDLYARAGAWLAAHGGAATSVAYLEVGEVGYDSDARVIDLLGLVTPGAAAHVPFLDYAWAVERYQPEYYLENARFDPLLQDLHKQAWFMAAYQPVAVLDDQRITSTQSSQMTIYQRKPGAALPAPLRPVAIQRISQQPVWPTPGAPSAKWPGQSFTVSAPNLSAIALLLGKPDPAPPDGRVVLHLRRDPQDTQDLRRAEAPLSAIVNNSWYTFRFDPIPDSAGQQYLLTVEVVDVPASRPPLAIWYASDDLYAGGSRYQGGQAIPGDLCLRVSVADSGS